MRTTPAISALCATALQCTINAAISQGISVVSGNALRAAFLGMATALAPGAAVPLASVATASAISAATWGVVNAARAAMPNRSNSTAATTEKIVENDFICVDIEETEEANSLFYIAFQCVTCSALTCCIDAAAGNALRSAFLSMASKVASTDTAVHLANIGASAAISTVSNGIVAGGSAANAGGTIDHLRISEEDDTVVIDDRFESPKLGI